MEKNCIDPLIGFETFKLESTVTVFWNDPDNGHTVRGHFCHIPSNGNPFSEVLSEDLREKNKTLLGVGVVKDVLSIKNHNLVTYTCSPEWECKHISTNNFLLVCLCKYLK